MARADMEAGVMELKPLGDAGDALDWALDHINDSYERTDFLESWRDGDVGHWPDYSSWVAAQQRHKPVRTPDEELELLREARAALQRMMDTWLDYHDAHSLTEPVTGASENALDDALEARDSIDLYLQTKEPAK